MCRATGLAATRPGTLNQPLARPPGESESLLPPAPPHPFHHSIVTLESRSPHPSSIHCCVPDTSLAHDPLFHCPSSTLSLSTCGVIHRAGPRPSLLPSAFNTRIALDVLDIPPVECRSPSARRRASADGQSGAGGPCRGRGTRHGRVCTAKETTTRPRHGSSSGLLRLPGIPDRLRSSTTVLYAVPRAWKDMFRIQDAVDLGRWRRQPRQAAWPVATRGRSEEELEC